MGCLIYATNWYLIVKESDSVKELLSRKVNCGDLVLYDMKYALYVGENKLLVYYNSTYIADSRIYHDLYLVETPNQKEMSIKNSLMEAYNRQSQEKLKVAMDKMDKISLVRKNTKRGDIVKVYYSEYLYLGKAKFIDLDTLEYVGHVYIRLDVGGVSWSEKQREAYIKQLHNTNVDVSDAKDVARVIGTCSYYGATYSGLKEHNVVKILKNKMTTATEILGHYNLVGTNMVLPVECRTGGYNNYTSKTVIAKIELL